MPVLLVLVFVGVPLLELLVILQIGGAIGGWPTAALLIVFSIAGALLLKFEGRRAWAEFRRALSDGRWPGDEVAQGALIIVGGTLLVTPGFITDIVGFLLLLAPSRRLVARVVRKRMEGAVVIRGSVGPTGRTGSTGPDPDPRRAGARRPGRAPGPTVDGVPLDVEVVEIRREQPPLRGSTRASDGAGDLDANDRDDANDPDDVEVDDEVIDDEGSGDQGPGGQR